MDKLTTLQHYCEYPLVSTFSDSITYPNGQNTIVALILHGGQNQEDSIVANQSSIDCGMFNASHYSYQSTELEKGEQFGSKDPLRTVDVKKNGIYEFIDENHFIKVGTIARKNYILAVKTAKIPKPVDEYLYIDKSLVYTKDEPVYIERIVRTRNDEDILVAKIKYRADRPLDIGDKCSSRSGNKGIVSSTNPRIDMPNTIKGMTPDLMVNAHSIPTRLAINQMMECLLGRLAVRKGCRIDATSFTKLDLDSIIAELATYGITNGGCERMFNGRTGEWLDVMIFIGPTTYQRLDKFVLDVQYAIQDGPTNITTHQPQDGKNNNGGIRLGEMEKDVMMAHGSGRTLWNKWYNDSDGQKIYICRVCKNNAIVNIKLGEIKCKYCAEAADIAMVSSSWTANLFKSEASAGNIKMLYELEPHTYARMEE